jgi:hypothetical protein
VRPDGYLKKQNNLLEMENEMVKQSSKIFVFGSNQAGRHGAGAALYAAKFYNAKNGVGEGPQGQSYAIPTKDWNIQTLPLEDIQVSVNKFLDYARENPNTYFLVTRIGCGLAGHKDADIAPMFIGAPSNCEMPIEWAKYLP